MLQIEKLRQRDMEPFKQCPPPSSHLGVEIQLPEAQFGDSFPPEYKTPHTHRVIQPSVSHRSLMPRMKCDFGSSPSMLWHR